jgi:hypothetical protein
MIARIPRWLTIDLTVLVLSTILIGIASGLACFSGLGSLCRKSAIL